MNGGNRPHPNHVTEDRSTCGGGVHALVPGIPRVNRVLGRWTLLLGQYKEPPRSTVWVGESGIF